MHAADKKSSDIIIIPLVTDPLYLLCMAKISILEKEGIIEKFPKSVAPMSR